MLFFDGYGEIQKKQTSVAILSEKMLFLQHEISKTALIMQRFTKALAAITLIMAVFLPLDVRDLMTRVALREA